MYIGINKGHTIRNTIEVERRGSRYSNPDIWGASTNNFIVGNNNHNWY